ncbi:hypothetical protein [Actinomyces radicidentis]|uniref:C4-dicarboxylate ABC transporter n=1 Tax=Actinomyces radicidentis TaxID=111015 RepID=A0A0X8JFG6_ACTRD|nr:hypothetical protein [Actinomyces radicidentis]AMD87892.1 hypothetical protein AXF14_10270 [Actinomyces radicidentis]
MSREIPEAPLISNGPARSSPRRLGLLVSPDPLEVPRRQPLPPPGPVWFPSVMGTGILATTLHLSADVIGGALRAPVAALALADLAVAWALLLVLTLGYAARVIRDPGVLRAEIDSPFWGPVAMGLMSVGSATATVLPAHWPALAGASWAVDTVFWVLGTLLGLAAEVRHVHRVREGTEPVPSFVSCLAVLAPMVSSTVGAGVVPHLAHAVGGAVLVISFLCWVVSLVMGWRIFLAAYPRTLRLAPLPLGLSASAIIPLGIVGQSVAGIVAIATQAAAYVSAPTARTLLVAAHGWGWVMLALGLPMIVWGLLVLARGLRRRMPYSPGWFAATFPVGTMALGGIMLGRSVDVAAVSWLGVAACALLLGTVVLGLSGAVVHLVGDARAGRTVR